MNNEDNNKMVLYENHFFIGDTKSAKDLTNLNNYVVMYTKDKNDVARYKDKLKEMIHNVFVIGLLLGLSVGFLIAMGINHIARADVLSKSQTSVANEIVTLSYKHGAVAEDMLAIAYIESSLNPKARGAIGEVGAFQLLPKYHKVSAQSSLEEQFVKALKYVRQVKKSCGKVAWVNCYNRGEAGAKKVKNHTDTKYYKKFQRAKKRVSERVIANYYNRVEGLYGYQTKN